jgi:hypothetical protein
MAALEQKHRALVKAIVSEEAALARTKEEARKLREEIVGLEEANAAEEHPVESPPCVTILHPTTHTE